MNPFITPFEILVEKYLKPTGISQNDMCRACIEIKPGKRALRLKLPTQIN